MRSAAMPGLAGAAAVWAGRASPVPGRTRTARAAASVRKRREPAVTPFASSSRVFGATPSFEASGKKLVVERHQALDHVLQRQLRLGHAAPLGAQRCGPLRVGENLLERPRERLPRRPSARARRCCPSRTSSPVPPAAVAATGDARGHRLDDGQRAALVVARQERAFRLREQLGDVVAVAEEARLLPEAELAGEALRLRPERAVADDVQLRLRDPLAAPRRARATPGPGASAARGGRPSGSARGPAAAARAKRSSGTPFGITRYCSGSPTPALSPACALVLRERDDRAAPARGHPLQLRVEAEPRPRRRPRTTSRAARRHTPSACPRTAEASRPRKPAFDEWTWTTSARETSRSSVSSERMSSGFGLRWGRIACSETPSCPSSSRQVSEPRGQATSSSKRPGGSAPARVITWRATPPSCGCAASRSRRDWATTTKGIVRIPRSNQPSRTAGPRRRRTMT